MRRNIRTEVFDFMDLKEITFTHVRVDRWDKMMKPNTGSIIFSNNKFSGHVIRYSRYPNGIAIMSFQFVENPYDVLKYIQGIADIAKSEE